MIISLIVHIILCLISWSLCKKAKESEWQIFLIACLIPFIGPLWVVYAYIIYKIKEHLKDKDKWI